MDTSIILEHISYSFAMLFRFMSYFHNNINVTCQLRLTKCINYLICQQYFDLMHAKSSPRTFIRKINWCIRERSDRLINSLDKVQQIYGENNVILNKGRYNKRLTSNILSRVFNFNTFIFITGDSILNLHSKYCTIS